MAALTAALLGGAALGGAAGLIGGLQDKKTVGSVDAGTPGASEQYATGLEDSTLKDLAGLVNAGPGQQDVSNSLTSQRNLSQLLQQYAQSGGMPSAADINSSNDLASNLFASRRTALNQNFIDQNIASNQLAARLNRSSDDPILRARLLTNQSRMLDSLNSDQQGMATQIAMQLPGQRVGYAQGAASVDAALAAQASQNRASLLGLGQSVANQYTDYRLNTATRTNTQPANAGTAIGGMLGGMGMGMNIGGLFNSAFPGGASPLPLTNVLQRTQLGGPNGIEMPAYQSSPGVRSYALGDASNYA